MIRIMLARELGACSAISTAVIRGVSQLAAARARVVRFGDTPVAIVGGGVERAGEWVWHHAVGTHAPLRMQER